MTASATELLTNAGFETGDFTGWTRLTTGTPFVDWTVSPAGGGSGFFPPTSPQEGAYDAWNGFDGGGPMEFLLYQDVAIPGGQAVMLSWMHRVQWDFALTGTATSARLYDVQLRDPATNGVLATLFSFSTGIAHVVGDTGWMTGSADLSSFGGSTVRLAFQEQIPESFTGPGQIEFDAISIATPSIPEPGTILLLAAALAALPVGRALADAARKRA
jgi:hypothetical protein